MAPVARTISATDSEMKNDEPMFRILEDGFALLLPEADLREFTLSRLRAWLRLHAQDPGQSHALAGAYRAVFQRVSADVALRRASVVQSVARQELTAEELTELDDLIPDVLEPVAHARKESTPTSRLLEQQPVAVATERKPRWKFW